MNFLRSIRFDDSDDNVFERAAQPGEWVVSGAFAFAHLSGEGLTGKTRQAFANGFLGLPSFGRSTFAAVASIEEAEIDEVSHILAQHFIDMYGAPGMEVALPAAKEEVAFILELCEEARPGTVFMVRRELDEGGSIREEYRKVDAKNAPVQPGRIWEVVDDE